MISDVFINNASCINTSVEGISVKGLSRTYRRGCHEAGKAGGK